MKQITFHAISVYVILLSAINSKAQIYNYFAGSNAGSGNSGSNCVGIGVQCMGNGNKGSFLKIPPELIIQL